MLIFSCSEYLLAIVLGRKKLPTADKVLGRQDLWMQEVNKRLSQEVWANKRVSMAYISNNFNEGEGRNVPQYTVLVAYRAV